MLNVFEVLNAGLKAINGVWETVYAVKDNNLYCYAEHICRVEDLKEVYMGNGELILKFHDDDDDLFLTPTGYYFLSERGEMAAI